MKRIVSLMAVLATMGYAASASAVGTVANTQIKNTASATFKVGNDVITESSEQVTFAVDEILDVVVTGSAPTLVGSDPATQGADPLVDDINQVVSFVVTNTGNGTEDYLIELERILAGDDFETDAPTVSLYIDLNGDGFIDDGDPVFDPANQLLTLIPDQTVTFLVASNIPATLASGSTSFVDLTATSQTVIDNAAVVGDQLAGDVYLGAGDGLVDAIVGNTTAQDIARDIYLVNALVINLAKEAEKTASAAGTPDATLGLLGTAGVYEAPGDTITYRLTFTVAGDGELDDVFITDAFPFVTNADGSVTQLVDYTAESIRISVGTGPLAGKTDIASDNDGAFVGAIPAGSPNAGKPGVIVNLERILGVGAGNTDIVATTTPTVIEYTIVVEFDVVIP